MDESPTVVPITPSSRWSGTLPTEFRSLQLVLAEHRGVVGWSVMSMLLALTGLACTAASSGCRGSYRDGPAFEAAERAKDAAAALADALGTGKLEPEPDWGACAEQLIRIVEDEVGFMGYALDKSHSDEGVSTQLVYRWERSTVDFAVRTDIRVMPGDQSAIVIVSGWWREGSKEWRQATSPRVLLLERGPSLRLTNQARLER